MPRKVYIVAITAEVRAKNWEQAVEKSKKRCKESKQVHFKSFKYAGQHNRSPARPLAPQNNP